MHWPGACAAMSNVNWSAPASAMVAGTASVPAAVVEDILRIIERTPAGARGRLENAVPLTIKVPVDAQDLTEPLGDLIENGARHADARVHITARQDAGAVTLEVEGDGPGMSDADLAAALPRGGGLDEAGGGAGLGLAIMQDLAAAYGAGRRFARSDFGALAVEVTLARDARYVGSTALG